MVETETHSTVLMTADTVGGVWTYCMELCKALQPCNVTVHLVTMGEKMKAWQRKEAAEMQNVVVHETGFRLEWMQNPWQDIKECSEWLLQLEEEIQPDIIHLNCFAYGSLSFNAPVVVVAHSDVYSWFLSVKRENPDAEWNRYYALVKNGLHGANRLIAPSKTMLQFIQFIYGIDKGQVIYNGRSEERFYSARKKPVVFSMGRIWDEAKNIKLLVEAATFTNAQIKIAGDNRFGQNNIEVEHHNIEYIGKLSTEQIAEQLSAASIFVLPAKYEPFGLSALEAALSGCALVLGNIPSLKEIWQDAAIYVDTEDAEALARTLHQLLNDKNLLSKFRQKAKLHAKQFSAAAMAQNYNHVYRQLVQQKNRILKQATL